MICLRCERKVTFARVNTKQTNLLIIHEKNVKKIYFKVQQKYYLKKNVALIKRKLLSNVPTACIKINCQLSIIEILVDVTMH